MEVGDWITLGAVIVALGIGVASILYTQYLQKKERKERLLNEVIKWAEDIRKSSSESINPSKIILDAGNVQIATQQGFRALRRRCQDLNTKSAYKRSQY